MGRDIQDVGHTSKSSNIDWVDEGLWAASSFTDGMLTTLAAHSLRRKQFEVPFESEKTEKLSKTISTIQTAGADLLPELAGRKAAANQFLEETMPGWSGVIKDPGLLEMLSGKPYKELSKYIVADRDIATVYQNGSNAVPTSQAEFSKLKHSTISEFKSVSGFSDLQNVTLSESASRSYNVQVRSANSQLHSMLDAHERNDSLNADMTGKVLWSTYSAFAADHALDKTLLADRESSWLTNGVDLAAALGAGIAARKFGFAGLTAIQVGAHAAEKLLFEPKKESE